MATPSDEESGVPPTRKRQHFTPGFWVVLVALALPIAAVVFYRPGPIDRIPRIQLEISSISMALQAYQANYSRFPSGDNRAILRALRGENPRKIMFLNVGEESVTPAGDLLDPWGTPYELDTSGDAIAIRSAGPNRLFGDTDDKSLEDYK